MEYAPSGKRQRKEACPSLVVFPPGGNAGTIAAAGAAILDHEMNLGTEAVHGRGTD